MPTGMIPFSSREPQRNSECLLRGNYLKPLVGRYFAAAGVSRSKAGLGRRGAGISISNMSYPPLSGRAEPGLRSEMPGDADLWGV